MGNLIESIDTLISDWLTVEVKVSIPCLGCYAAGIKDPVRSFSSFSSFSSLSFSHFPSLSVFSHFSSLL